MCQNLEPQYTYLGRLESFTHTVRTFPTIYTHIQLARIQLTKTNAIAEGQFQPMTSTPEST